MRRVVGVFFCLAAIAGPPRAGAAFRRVSNSTNEMVEYRLGRERGPGSGSITAQTRQDRFEEVGTRGAARKLAHARRTASPSQPGVARVFPERPQPSWPLLYDEPSPEEEDFLDPW